uniref:Uncharacterized protein n=1 Tax=Parascaris univalens TaxID=6257 RepID=A0A915CLH8_PARUN
MFPAGYHQEGPEPARSRDSRDGVGRERAGIPAQAGATVKRLNTPDLKKCLHSRTSGIQPRMKLSNNRRLVMPLDEVPGLHARYTQLRC